jgi:ATP-dependent Lhr-like helicase
LPPAEIVAVARAEAHLDRLGIVTRGAVLASGDPGGFASAYRTLSMMEERGKVQRVYAVEGLGASQFALTGVVDQVRAVERELAERQPECLLLATADPANAYGAALEWPASDWAGGSGAPHRPSRGAGCHVVLIGGRPVLYAERGGHTLLTFQQHSGGGSDQQGHLATATRLLHDAVRSGSIGALTISRVNGSPVMELPASDDVRCALEAAGFGLTPRGYRVPR